MLFRSGGKREGSGMITKEERGDHFYVYAQYIMVCLKNDSVVEQVVLYVNMRLITGRAACIRPLLGSMCLEK